MRWSTPSTTDDANRASGRFRIIHPFHPQTGKEFEIITWRRNWTENRVYFCDNRKRLRSVPEGWTDLVVDDPVVVLGGGRSHFRVRDLLELADLLRELRS